MKGQPCMYRVQYNERAAADFPCLCCEEGRGRMGTDNDARTVDTGVVVTGRNWLLLRSCMRPAGSKQAHTWYYEYGRYDSSIAVLVCDT